ncbi:unnamed protein product, partial [Chrysoparadoxa australica]
MSHTGTLLPPPNVTAPAPPHQHGFLAGQLAPGAMATHITPGSGQDAGVLPAAEAAAPATTLKAPPGFEQRMPASAFVQSPPLVSQNVTSLDVAGDISHGIAAPMLVETSSSATWSSIDLVSTLAAAPTSEPGVYSSNASFLSLQGGSAGTLNVDDFFSGNGTIGSG